MKEESSIFLHWLNDKSITAESIYGVQHVLSVVAEIKQYIEANPGITFLAIHILHKESEVTLFFYLKNISFLLTAAKKQAIDAYLLTRFGKSESVSCATPQAVMKALQQMIFA
jgi:hypothetical protein